MDDLTKPQGMLSVAPMIDITNRFFRYFMRQITRRTTLYTEMIHANAVQENPGLVLQYDPIEHPVVFQLGGSDADTLSTAAETCQNLGFDEINLNCGCPSERVSSGRFGACLMLEPETVKTLCATITRKITIPLSVKCRLGVDDQDKYEDLYRFIDTVRQGGVRHFVVHARKAILKGLTPEQNRKIPPLQYDKVYRLLEDFPELQFTINGGFKSHETIEEALGHSLKGVMLGRCAYDNPMFFRDVDSRYYADTDSGLSRRDIMQRYALYCQEALDQGVQISNSVLAKPLTNLFRAQAGNSYYRVTLNSCMLNHDFDDNFQGMTDDLIARLEREGVAGLDTFTETDRTQESVPGTV